MADENTSGSTYGIKKLDYPPIPINMTVSNPIEATYRINACSKEPWTVEFIEGLSPDTWLIDVGANVGSYTLVAAARGLKAVAIEPAYESFRSLCNNLLMNGWLDRAIPLCMAVSAKTGFDWLAFNDVRSGGNGNGIGGDAKPEFQHHRQVIPVMRLDDLMQLLPIPPTAPIAIKIDVDGGELGVLQGAVNLLGSERVTAMMIEIQRDQEQEIVGWLALHGWVIGERFDERPQVDGAHLAGGRMGNIFYARFVPAGALVPA